MIQPKKYFSIHRLLGLTLALTMGMGDPCFAQGLGGESLKNGRTEIKSIRFGSHPKDTRIVIQLSKESKYEVQPDLKNRKYSIVLENARLAPRVRPKAFKDKNLERIDLTRSQNKVKITLTVKNQNIRLTHFSKAKPPQIVLDFGGKVQSAKVDQKSTGEKKPTELPPKVKPSRIPGLTRSQVEQIIQKDTEEKLKSGTDDYKKALLLYQTKRYPEALEAFRKFKTDYPKSKFLSDTAYLAAEAEYNITFREPFPNYEKALTAYKYATRQFPDSKFNDHALFKLATIYDELNYTLEATTFYREGLKRDKRSLYNSAREIGLANMLMKGNKFGEAFGAFKIILKRNPKNQDARAAIFNIAEWYYKEGDFKKAIKIYEDAAGRWPNELNKKPQHHFVMAEIYFTQKSYGNSRKHYFNFINLDPESDNAHKALNKIGDTYLLEGNHFAALSVFDKSSKLNPGSGESQYGTIRLADVGIRNPTLPIHDIIFDIEPYFKPYETYDNIFNEAKSEDVLAEVTLSRGIAFLKDQRYLKAIDEFKKLLPFGAQTSYYQASEKFIKQALVLLIEHYSNQGGHLPTLYVYNDYLTLGLGQVNNIKTLMQIGESYQAIGMNAEALKFFEKVKFSDINEVYTDRLFLNLGQIHLDEKNFKEAEVVSRTFLNQFPRSQRIPEAMKILAKSFKGREMYENAIQVYKELLKKKDIDKSETYYLLGDIHFSKNDMMPAIQSFTRSIANYDASIRNPPDHIKNAYYRLGVSLYSVKEFPKALKALQIARKRFPGHSLREWADYLIADCHFQLRNQGEAVAELQGIVSSDPSQNLLKRAAESKLKVLDWEKRFKDLL